MEDKDTQLLARAAANHLHLGQFEPFRATLLALRVRNPHLALAILQTLISLNGRLENISCPSSPLLAYLSTLELLQFNPDDAVSSLWSFDPLCLRLRVEFSLYVETIISKLKESGESESESLLVLGKLAELGFRRLIPDSIAVDETEKSNSANLPVVLEEEELTGLRRVVLENALLFDVLCGNIRKQAEGGERGDNESGLAITLRREGERLEEEDMKLLKLVQRSVQMVHLDAMRESIGKGDKEGAVSHIRFLHLGYEVEETEYRYGLSMFLID